MLSAQDASPKGLPIYRVITRGGFYLHKKMFFLCTPECAFKTSGCSITLMQTHSFWHLLAFFSSFFFFRFSVTSLIHLGEIKKRYSEWVCPHEELCFPASGSSINNTFLYGEALSIRNANFAHVCTYLHLNHPILTSGSWGTLLKFTKLFQTEAMILGMLNSADK